jgi:hypothetical protein
MKAMWERDVMDVMDYSNKLGRGDLLGDPASTIVAVLGEVH